MHKTRILIVNLNKNEFETLCFLVNKKTNEKEILVDIDKEIERFIGKRNKELYQKNDKILFKNSQK